ncbi:MAG: hypothetical protein K2P93_02625 [Alphaproteobacteria bacterium]|nr:hypothetical protein [Alphaproteobacteria bacterium]
MAEIIDLDFYRKFRVILPVRPNALSKNRSSMVSRIVAKRYRRRQKEDSTPLNTKKE